MPAEPLEDDGLYALRRLGEKAAQIVQQRVVDGIALLGTIEGNHRHGFVRLDPQRPIRIPRRYGFACGTHQAALPIAALPVREKILLIKLFHIITFSGRSSARRGMVKSRCPVPQ